MEQLNITKGDWFSKGQNIYTEIDDKPYHLSMVFAPETMLSIRKHNDNKPNEENEANAKAICNAVNNTYGKGVDPLTIPELLKENERLRAINGEMKITLQDLAVQATFSTKNILCFDGAEELDKAIDKATDLVDRLKAELLTTEK